MLPDQTVTPGDLARMRQHLAEALEALEAERARAARLEAEAQSLAAHYAEDMRDMAAQRGAAVLVAAHAARHDLALRRVARASLHMHRASEAAHAAPIGSGDYDAAIDATNAAYEEWRAALAALGDMELLGEEPPR